MAFDGLIRAVYGDLHGMATQQKGASARILDAGHQMANQHLAYSENYWDPLTGGAAAQRAQQIKSQADDSATCSEAQAAATNQGADMYQSMQSHCANMLLSG